MKQLIVYYSFTQNNELLAKALQLRLGCDLLKIETVKKRSAMTIFLDILFNRKPALRSYRVDHDVEQYVFVAPIWAGRIASPLKAFLQDERNNIKHYSFITFCGGIQGQKEKIENELTKLLTERPRKVMELWVSDLLAAEQKKNVTGYRATEKDLAKYKAKIDEFVVNCNSAAFEEMNARQVG